MFAPQSSPAEFSGIFDADLLTGESIRWTGQPLTRIIFRRSDWFAIPFSLAWGGFALFWEFGASGGINQQDHSAFSPPHFNFFSLWGIPFVLIGQYMIWGRFFYTSWKKTQTFYAVTNKRILVLSAGSGRKLTDCFIAGLNSVSVTSRRDGAGTIEFAPEPDGSGGWFSSNRRYNNGQQMSLDLSRLAFYDVADVAQVYKIIQDERNRKGDAVNTN